MIEWWIGGEPYKLHGWLVTMVITLDSNQLEMVDGWSVDNGSWLIMGYNKWLVMVDGF